MGLYDISAARLVLAYEWQRQTFDAFILPVYQLGLTAVECRSYVGKAFEAVHRLDWETYDTQRRTFLRLAEELLKVRALTPPVREAVCCNMYVRFMEGRIRFFEYLEREERCPLPAVPVREQDLENTVLASVFAHLPDQPETAVWLASLQVSWMYDQLHMVSWFSGQLSLGSGKYSRSRPNHSAKLTYERLLNPFSLLWIAAALGEDREVVARTRKEIDGYVSWRAKCGMVRRAIPWKRIYELALPFVEEERNRLQMAVG